MIALALVENVRCLPVACALSILLKSKRLLRNGGLVLQGICA